MDIWELTVRFFSLADANVRHVVAGSILLGSAAGGLGSFAFLQRRSLMGDTLAHAALPGVGLAFLLAGRKEFIYLLLGAALSGWAGALAINYIVSQSKLKLDAALGIVLSVFFGLGIVILTHIQQSGSGAQSGLDKFLFGQAAAMSQKDVVILGIVGILMLLIIGVWFDRFKLISFDPGFARSMGLRTGWWQFLLTTMIVSAVTIGLQAVGVVLIAAMLITPAASARQWTDSLKTMVMLASVFGALSGLMGTYVSFLAPKFPTGPWMVVVVSSLFLFSLLFAPERGVFSRLRRHMNNRRKMTTDHILKVMFKLGEQTHDWQSLHSLNQLMRMWSFNPHELKTGLNRLVKAKLLRKEQGQFRFSEAGIKEGARITRLHRLWEVYLTRYLDLPEDHVHRDAEEMEHIITPEVEEQLEQLLDRPEYDPHRKEIPYIGREKTS